MIDPVHERRAPISPQLAVRVATLGVVAFVLFAVIFFRLWFLQGLSGDQYVAQATQNRVRQQPVQAPRGDIVDAAGNTLVDNRQAIVLQLDPQEVPDEELVLAAKWGDAAAARKRKPKGAQGRPVPIPAVPASLRERFVKLRKVTGLTVAAVQELVVVGLYRTPFAPVKLKTDVKPAVRQYVEEHRKEFLGLEARTVFVREYPHGPLAAQVFGTIGQITKKQVGRKRYRGLRQGSVVGQGGLERTYDRYLRGQDGVERFYVDAGGRQVGQTLARRGRVGRTLATSIDLDLQRVGQQALARAGGGKPGAFVAMDPYTGEVKAMGSAPSFDPNIFSRPLTEKRFEELFAPSSRAPLTNRAVSSQYPTGSTFKIVTALAGLSKGLITPEQQINDPGRINLFPKDPNGYRQNAKAEPNGAVNLRKALKVSSDIYFYLLGKDIFERGGRALQDWSHKLGFGRLTGIDTGAETKGVVPSAEQRAASNKVLAKAERKCRAGTRSLSGTPKAAGAACGISDLTDPPFTAGDDVNLAIGQGDLQATPLQVALAYSAIATGGKIPTPHFGREIQDDRGRLVSPLPVPPSRSVKLPAAGLTAIRDGLHQATSESGGTSFDVFKGWDQGRWPIYGKTGTASFNPPKEDQSWYAAYVPPSAQNRKPLLVVVTVEGGGFGAAAAAPAARQLFSQWYTGKPGPFTAGSSFAR